MFKGDRTCSVNLKIHLSLKLIYDSFWMTIDIKMIFSNKPNCGNV